MSGSKLISQKNFDVNSEVKLRDSKLDSKVELEYGLKIDSKIELKAGSKLITDYSEVQFTDLDI